MNGILDLLVFIFVHHFGQIILALTLIICALKITNKLSQLNRLLQNLSLVNPSVGCEAHTAPIIAQPEPQVDATMEEAFERAVTRFPQFSARKEGSEEITVAPPTKPSSKKGSVADLIKQAARGGRK